MGQHINAGGLDGEASPSAPRIPRPSLAPVIGILLFGLFALPASGSALPPFMEPLAVLPAVVSSAIERAAIERTAIELDVRVEGVPREMEENIRRFLSIVRAAEAEDVLPDRIRRFHRGAEDEIRRALRPFGYYRPRIESVLETEEERWTARYVVDLGPPVLVEGREVELIGPGDDHPVLLEQRAAFPLEPGDRLEHPAYEAGRDLLHAVALEQGFLDAFWLARQVEVDTVAGAAWIRLRLSTGPRYSFGEVTFHRDDREDLLFAEDFLRRFVPFRAGDPYRSIDLLAFQDALAQSAYFRRVEVAARPEEARDLRVPVEVTLTPATALLYGVGGGYGTDTGPRATASLDWNRVNERGHRILAEGHVSFVSRRLGGRYIIPVGHGFASRLSVGTAYDGSFFEDVRSEVLRAVVAFDRDWRGLRQRFSVEVFQEWFEVGDDSGDRTMVMPVASVSRTRADGPIFVERGHRVLGEVKGSHQAIGSDNRFIQARAEGRLVRSPWERGRVLVRLEVGSTATPALRGLPTSVRFFAGGDDSVRGFGFRRLGPRDAEGRLIGGRHLLTGSLEVEQRFAERWGAAAFLDAGNVWADLEALPVEVGAGIGARWVSPVGLARVDLATALTRPGIPLRLHLTLGPDL